MFNEIKYFAPYFNNTNELRDAYKLLYPNYDFDLISSLMVGALSVYVPEEKFQQLVADTLSEANAKLNLN
jgi:hypothetical protein